MTLSRLALELYEKRQQTEDRGNELTDKEQDYIDKISSETELEFIAHGAGRIVMRQGDSVIKSARGGDNKHSDGKQQNKAEIRIWSDNMGSPYLAEPLDWDDTYLRVKYPYIKTFEEHSEFDMNDAVRASAKIKEKITHIDNINTLDITRENIGIRDGQVKITDYGSVK